MTQHETGSASRISRFLRKDEAGSTVVEFAMVFPIFIGLLYFIFQSAFTFLAHHTLDYGVHETARMVRTGQITNVNLSKQKFKESICSFVALGQSDCMARIAVEMTPIGGAPDFGPPTKNNKLDDSDGAYDSGGSGSLMMIKAFLPATHLNMVQDVINLLPGVDDKERPDALIHSISLFRNEPF